MELVESSLKTLEWPRLLAIYAEHCYSTPGREAALNVQAAQSPEMAETLLDLTGEAIKILEKESFSFLHDLPDSELSIERLSKQQILDGKELVQILQLLVICSLCCESAKKWAKDLSALAALVAPLKELPQVRKELSATLELDGKVRDSASEKLHALRQEERKLHMQARERLDQVLQKSHRDGYLQDNFFDVRDGRYIIPVKSEHRHQVPGFLMESSATKATVFIEPAAVRDINDRLKQVELEIQEEIYVILCRLCEGLFPYADALLVNIQQVVDFELCLGRGRFALSLQSVRGISRPSFGKDIYLEGIYHPLLARVLKASDIVRNTFSLSPDHRVLVISGPNTGGKTVLLKAVGLAALMAKHGFFLACAGEARLPFFLRILAQIGDAQSIEQSLSSFSASISKLLDIIRAASPKTLILIDEILHSTDPDEAAALSQSILHNFFEMGATAIVTTHLNGLKVANSQRFGNASMEFSIDTMKPTYRLRMGVPGSSRAIEIATQLGLPSKIAIEAKALLGKGQARYDELLNTLEDREKKLSDALEQISQEQTALATEKARVEALNQQIREERQRFQITAKESLRSQEREATQKLENIIREYKSKLEDLNQKQSAALEAKSKIQEIRESYAPKEELNQLAPVPEETFSIGDGFELRGLVYIQHIKNQGTLLSDPRKKDQPAEIQVGNLRMRVDWDKLTPLTRKGKPIIRRGNLSTQTVECDPEINVIGKTVDDALEQVKHYVDRASRSGRPSVRIVHGSGSGALRKAIREFLRGERQYEMRFRPGAQNEGGEGCTVVEFTS